MLDCAIIGAGLAGLVAARDLRNRGLGVVVLEARDRVGGRIENGVLADGQYVELGGQWIGAGHDAIFDLVERYGLRTIGIPAQGNLVVRVHGRLLEVPSAQDGEELTPFEVADLSQGLLRLRRLAHRLADDPAWVAANEAWLQQNLRRWVRTNLRTGGAQARFGEVYEAAFGTMAPDATLLEGLRQINSGPSLETMIANNGGLNQQRVDGGMAALCEALAADLGDAVRLGNAVTRIGHGDVASVTLASGETIEARTVISTLPPRLAVALEYDPPLPQWRLDVAQRVAPGNVIKAYLVYETPFWRERGLSGQSSSDEGAVRVTFDTTLAASERGLLMGFFEGNEAGSLAVPSRTGSARSSSRPSGLSEARPPSPSSTSNGTGRPSSTPGAATGHISHPGSGPPAAPSWRPPTAASTGLVRSTPPSSTATWRVPSARPRRWRPPSPWP